MPLSQGDWFLYIRYFEGGSDFITGSGEEKMRGLFEKLKADENVKQMDLSQVK